VLSGVRGNKECVSTLVSLGWKVPDLAAAIDGLVARGVTFVSYPYCNQLSLTLLSGTA
jgi:hypothetical protein